MTVLISPHSLMTGDYAAEMQQTFGNKHVSY
jgi:hypothetical protein